MKPEKMAAPPPTARLQHMLQSAVQAVKWSYSLFWQFCPQKGMLVWCDGYYNGVIKTRKTVQLMEVSEEEESLQRSQQLRELYDSLSAGETEQKTAKRPCAALSPEDLTETEWFYLMCVSFSFSPGIGLPGKAYTKMQHVWLTGAHEVDCKIFSRAILAKSAGIQTVVCIPVLDGVVEVGTTDRIQEDLSVVQLVKAIFMEHQLRHNHDHHAPSKPALSEHSTSNPAASSSYHSARSFHSSTIPAATMYAATDPSATFNGNQVDPEVDDDDKEDDVTNESDSEAETGRNSGPVPEAIHQNQANQAHMAGGATTLAHTTTAEPSELMQLDMSEDIRLGSPDDASNNLESDFPVMGGGHGRMGFLANATVGPQRRADSFSRIELARRWRVVQHDTLLQPPLVPPPLPPPSPGTLLMEELSQDDTHYSQTVSSILQSQSNRWSSDPSPAAAATSGGGYLTSSTSLSAFSKWTSRSNIRCHIPAAEGGSQWLLKYILFTVPLLHAKFRDETSPKSRDPAADPSSRLRNKGTAQDELSANHVLAERRRREKLNERFIILRSLVPFVTKMDKASILGDTIEYVKQLRRKIQELEARTRQMEAERAGLVETAAKSNSSGKDQQQRSQSGVTGARVRPGRDKRKVRVVEGSGGGATATVVESPQSPPAVDMLQVSIIESNGLIELHCPYKEGLLVDMMLTLRELRVEVTAVQSSLNNGFFTAELRAKVKENVNGKKASIVEVKRAITQLVPHAAS